MKPRTLLVLTVLVVALGAFIWFYERDLPSSDKRAELADKLYHGLEVKDVQGVTLQWAGNEIHLERQAIPEAAKSEEAEGKTLPKPPKSSWRMTKPLATRADAALVDRFVGTLASLDTQRKLEKVDRAAVGLDKPRATVTLDTADGPLTLQVGAEVPTSQGAVVAFAGSDDASIVPSWIYSRITRKTDEWRDHRVFSESAEDLDRVTLETGTPAGELALARQGEGFALEQPPGTKIDQADREEVRTFFSQLAALKIDRFLDHPDQPLAAIGLEPPQAVVEATAGKAAAAPAGKAAATPVSKPVRLAIGSQAGDGGARYGEARDQVFVAKMKEISQALARPLAGWRSHAWTDLEVYQVDAAHLEDAHGALDLERAGTDWRRNDKVISFSTVSDLLYSVTDAHADEVLTGREAAERKLSLTKPELTVVFKGKEIPEETLTLFPQAGDHYPAKVSGRNVVLMLPGKTVTELRDHLEKVRQAEPLKNGKETTGRVEEKFGGGAAAAKGKPGAGS